MLVVLSAVGGEAEITFIADFRVAVPCFFVTLQQPDVVVSATDDLPFR